MVKMDIWERLMLPEGLRIPLLGGWIYRGLSVLARKRVQKMSIEKLSLNKSKREQILTCSLTTFPDRIDTVQYTIKSLFNQSVKPDRIILWLATSEFEHIELPESIHALVQRGLEIRYCDNYYGHKRYYKLIEEQQENECIIMFDDDIIFPYYLIERLYDKWRQFPDCIICDRGQLITFEGNMVVDPRCWSATSNEGIDEPSYKILASPGGGCLLPPRSLYKDAANTELISKYALKTGDVWLMFQAVQNDTRIVRTHKYHRIFILTEKTQTVQLGRDAIYSGRYMKSFEALLNAYPHAYQNMILQ